MILIACIELCAKNLLAKTKMVRLLFTSQPNFISESDVNASLYPRCHRQIIYAKVNLKVYYPPPPYERLVWNYSKAEFTNIRKKSLPDKLA